MTTSHEGLAGSIETSHEVTECFQRSLSKKHSQYTQYIGDGDSKAYSEVVKSDPYSSFKVGKLECVGHIQNHFGT